jgi:hypothetical protein
MASSFYFRLFFSLLLILQVFADNESQEEKELDNDSKRAQKGTNFEIYHSKIVLAMENQIQLLLSRFLIEKSLFFGQ